MALQVASMLDEVAFKQDWCDTIQTTLNNALASIKVSAGYSILVTLANRSYLIESGDSTRLSISIVPTNGVAKALAKAKARLVISPDAMKEVEDLGSEWNEVMLEKRKLQIQGDQQMYNKLQKELDYHMMGLQRKVEASGPDVSVLKRAIEQHNASIDAGGLELAKFQEQLTVQMAHITADAAEQQPPVMHIYGWVLFSAISTMQGNMGQSNYTAANQLLDATSFSMRNTNSDNFQAVTVMWGAIGGLGMRLKAFGSQDMLALVDNTDDVLMTVSEAKDVLTYIVDGISPEWVGAWKNTKEYNDYMMVGWNPNKPGVSPWGKGKGGGLSFAQPDAEAKFHSEEKVESQQAPQAPKHTNSWLFAGRRVRTCGLVLHAELNGVKGTLVEEAEPGVWQVLLDDNLGEKLLKVQNMTSLSGAPLAETSEAGATPAMQKSAAPEVKPEVVKKMMASSISIGRGRETGASPAPEVLCIAGSWDDWMPQDMHWDDDQGCHTCNVQLSSTSDTKFGVNRGKAGLKRWAVRPKTWSMGSVVGSYQIQVFMRNRLVDKVEWVKST